MIIKKSELILTSAVIEDLEKSDPQLLKRLIKSLDLLFPVPEFFEVRENHPIFKVLINDIISSNIPN